MPSLTETEITVNSHQAQIPWPLCCSDCPNEILLQSSTSSPHNQLWTSTPLFGYFPSVHPAVPSQACSGSTFLPKGMASSPPVMLAHFLVPRLLIVWAQLPPFQPSSCPQVFCHLLTQPFGCVVITREGKLSWFLQTSQRQTQISSIYRLTKTFCS